MDLEQLKQEWQKNEAFQKEVRESVIKEMISRRSQGAFNQIKQNEKAALKIIPVSVVSFLLCSTKLLLEGGWGMLWVLLMIPIGVLLWYWSRWLCRFLDKIDMNRMSVSEVSGYINQYRVYLIRHTVFAVLLMPLYLGIWVRYYFASFHNGACVVTTEMLILYLASCLVLFSIIIWFRFFRHIGEIRRNLKELKEF